MKLADYLKNYFEFLVFWVLNIILPTVNKRNDSLLLINTGQIGDLVVSSVLLENPKIFNGYEKVQFLIRHQYLELFKNYKGRVEFIGYNYINYKFSLIYKFKFLSILRKEGFKKCIHLTAARGILNEEITHLVGAKETIALNSFWKYLGNSLGKYFDKKYSRIIASDILNEYEKHYELIKFLGGSETKIVFNNDVTFGEENNSINKNFEDYKESIVIAPFSSLMNREWKREYYFASIHKLKENHKIVLLGAENQKKDLEELSGKSANVRVLAGELKLHEIPILLKKAKLFIGQDSGLTHIALKMGTPLIAIIGGGEFGRFFPYKESEKVKYLYSKMDCFLCHWQCKKKEMFCITEISADDVILEVKNVFSN